LEEFEKTGQIAGFETSD